MRDVQNRYRGLPLRTPDMLHSIVRKFYRGAVSHYDLIQEKKAEVRAAWVQSQDSKDDTQLRLALSTLFLEFHFYVTCWLQIELALYRLARQNEAFAAVQERFQEELEKHLAVREQVDDTQDCVQKQFDHDGAGWSCVHRDAYWFDTFFFTVDEHSLQTLHDLYHAIELVRQQPE